MSDFLDIHDDAATRRVLITAALLLIVIPFLQAGAQLWPVQPRNIRWRYDAATSLSSVLILPFMGVALLRLVGRALESDAMTLILTIGSWLMTALLAASVIVFALDAIQLKTIVSSQMLPAFQATSLRVVLVTLCFGAGFLILATAGSRGGSRRVSSARRGRNTPYAYDEEDEDDYAPRAPRRGRADLLP